MITEFLRRAEKKVDSVDDDTSLWGGGLEFDSLEAAELSAMLEDEFGSDPFSAAGDMPETVGDILAFYTGASLSSTVETAVTTPRDPAWSGDPR